VSQATPKSSARWSLYAVITLFVLVTVAFLIAFITTTETEMKTGSQAPAELKPDAYLDTVTALLAGADPAAGPQLVQQYGCAACHREGAVNKIAPSFEGVAARAAARRPPLTAAAYIYESITNPMAFVVAGFSPVMPQNYPQRLSQRELGDIIAYLLNG
jgi:cytochrome c551/c552